MARTSIRLPAIDIVKLLAKRKPIITGPRGIQAMTTTMHTVTINTMLLRILLGRSIGLADPTQETNALGSGFSELLPAF